ncbi:MAG: RnfABCDGE type electron transport complex subunit B [Candidatus Marinimicrobia bacterium]|nr:RnfABCDGE type electron transport complex subunit B [Candidatus Neomarinimicrobiota bacterium]MBL7022863.1 RnfABCDGE type electron transport complex subunit B [Candidatus Neomarinimicrobiota bacterium]MBL7109182.1 RnfABCDGE type electron transport complex subunit B [Candidatus Neomarinimicrobiota bacterium]
MDINAILISMVSMGGLGILFSAGLSIANKKLYVEEDSRIVQIADELPGANCGGCGLPGCNSFAENVVNAKIGIDGCPVSTEDAVAEIATIMGIEAVAGEKKIARIICRGGNDETAKKADYHGIQTCTAAKLMGGGEKLCNYGCLGFGECVDACPFDAIFMTENGLPEVIKDKCTGCGKCAEACPREIIEIHPISNKLFVLCKNHDAPKIARTVCTKACIGCQICVRAVDEGAMFMDNHLAKINYDVFGKHPELPTEKCSTKGLVIIEHESQPTEQISI